MPDRRKHAADRREREAKRREKLGQSLGHHERVPLDQEVAAKLLFKDTSVIDLINQRVIDDTVDLTAALQAGPALIQTVIGPERTALGVELAQKKITRKEDRLGLKRARQTAAGRAEVMVNPVTMHTAAVKFDPRPSMPALPAGHLRSTASKELLAERAAARANRIGGGLGSRVNLLHDVESTEPDVLKGPLVAEDAAPGEGKAANEGGLDAAKQNLRPDKEEMRAKKNAAASSVENSLNVQIGKIRNYLELLDQYSLHHFLVYRARTLRSTPEFKSFERKYAIKWADVELLIGELERLLRRHRVDLAVIDGARLAEVATAALDGWSREDVISCIENKEQVMPLLNLPGQGRPEGRTKRERQISAATTIQALGRLYVARVAYHARIQRERAARLVQTMARAVRARALVQGMLRRERTETAGAWAVLRDRLQRQWRVAAAPAAPAGAKTTTGVVDGVGNFTFPPMRGRLELHIPSLSIEEHLRLVMERFPLEQNYALARLSALQDPNLAHIIYVTPRELPPDVVEYWMKVLELGGVQEPQRRITFVVPEMAEVYPAHLSLASIVLYSPAAVKRLKKLCARYEQRLLMPGVAGWQEKLLAVKFDTPLLAPEPAAAQLYRSHSGAKVAFTSAGVNIPIGAHDIYDQEDLVIALTKLIASNLDIENWLLKVDGDYENFGTAVLPVSNFRTVHELRSERSDLVKLHPEKPNGPSVWMNPDVQLLARAKLLKDLKINLPNEVFFVTPRAFESWPVFLKHFIRVGGVIEAEPPPKSLCGHVAANLLLGPDGTVSVNSCQDIIVGATRRVIGAVYPQRTVPMAALEAAAAAVGSQLVSEGVTGYASASFVVFRDKGSGNLRMWGESMELHLTSSALAHWTASLLTTTSNGASMDQTSLAGSTSSTSFGGSSSMASSVGSLLTSNKTGSYVITPALHHPKLSGLLFSSFFKLCRLQGISFDLRNKAGVVFNIYDSMACGTMGILTIGPSAPAATRIMSKALAFMKKHIGSRTAAGAAAVARGEDDGYCDFLEFDDAIKIRIKLIA